MASVARSGWRAVLFDLDGTLIDSRPGMQTALRSALRDAVGNETLAVGADFSLPLEGMIRSSLGAASDDAVNRVAAAFRNHYDTDDWREAALYPGAEQCLKVLRRGGIRMFIVTNKRLAVATRLVTHFGLRPYFEAIFGQSDSAPARPKSLLAGECLANAGLDPASVVVVGDSDSDAAMAASHGIAFVAYTAGTGPLSQDSEPRTRLELARLVDVGTVVVERSLWR